MPEVARGQTTDTVQSPHGVGPGCSLPAVYATDENSSKVKVEGIGVVREGDAMQTHPQPPCVNHAPTLDVFSSKVRIEGRGVGRVGDSYDGHTILSGSNKVKAG